MTSSKYLVVLAALAAVSLTQDTSEKITEEELVKLTINNNLDPNASYRCGVFFAGRKNKKPRMKIFILPKRFETSCAVPNPDIYKARCKNLFGKIMKRVTWQTASRRPHRSEQGYRVGDDVCEIFHNGTGMTEVPNAKIKKGLQIGFYYNYCGNIEWLDTELRAPDRLCCDGDTKFKKCN